LREFKVGEILTQFLLEDGWEIERDVSGRRGVTGPDIIANKNNKTLCIEVKGNAGNDLTDFKTGLGQLVINMYTETCSAHAIAMPEEGYQKYVEDCAKWFKEEGIGVFLVKNNESVIVVH
jgi:hypothetical protein